MTMSPTPTADTMMIGIFSFRNALFTLLMADEEEDGLAAASSAAWFGGGDVGAGAGAGAGDGDGDGDGGALVWLSRTLTKSACAEAGSVMDSSWTYGSAVVSTLPSTKSPKLMSRYAFRTAPRFSVKVNIGGGDSRNDVPKTKS